MPRSGGTYTLPAGNPVISGTTISSTWANTTLSDLGNEITNSLPRDGTAAPTANMTWGNFRLGTLGDPVNPQDAVNARTLQANGGIIPLSAVGGTSTAYTATAPLGFSAYIAGQYFTFIPNATNTGACTLNINGLGAVPIVSRGNSAIVAIQLLSSHPYTLYYDGTSFRIFAEGGVILTRVSSTAGASINLPHGAAPTTPNNGDMWTTTVATFVRINGATKTLADLESAQTISGVKTFSSTIIAPAATTALASIRLPHGAAPTTPTNGDMWTTTAAVFARVNGATKTLADLESTQTISGAKTFSTGPTLTNGATFSGSVIALNTSGTDFQLDLSSANALTFGSTSSNQRITLDSSASSIEVLCSNGTTFAPTILMDGDTQITSIGGFNVSNAGKVYGDSLHNPAYSVTGTTEQAIASGTYTPTLTAVSNVASTTASVCQWTRVGNVVTVAGKFSMTPTAAGSTQTLLGVSLPIASAFANDAQCGGVARSRMSGATGMMASVHADATNDRAEFEWFSGTTSAFDQAFTFTYVII